MEENSAYDKRLTCVDWQHDFTNPGGHLLAPLDTKNLTSLYQAIERRKNNVENLKSNK